jgi:hypothetical protein
MNTTASFKQGRFIRWYCNIWLGGMVYYLHHGDSSPCGPSYLVRPICPLSRPLSLTPPPDVVAVHTHTHHPPHDSQQPTPTHRHHIRSRGDPPAAPLSTPPASAAPLSTPPASAAPLSTPPACHPRHGRSIRGGRSWRRWPDSAWFVVCGGSKLPLALPPGDGPSP